MLTWLQAVDWARFRGALGKAGGVAANAGGGGTVALLLLFAHESQVGHPGIQVQVEQLQREVRILKRRCECRRRGGDEVEEPIDTEIDTGPPK